MPCHDQSQSSGSEFPSFPSDPEADSITFHQAVAEHNYKRVAEGLPTQNFFQLSIDGRTEVLARSSELNSASRLRVVPMPVARKKPLGISEQSLLLEEQRHGTFNLIGGFSVLAGAAILIVVLSRYL